MTNNQGEPALVKRIRGMVGASVIYRLDITDVEVRELLAWLDSPKPAAKAEPRWLEYLREIDRDARSQEGFHLNEDRIGELVRYLDSLAKPRTPLAPPAPQSEPGRWLFENVPIWKETATPKIVQFAWGEFDTAKREAWAKVEADCMAQGNDYRMREERDHYREKYLEAHKDRMGLVDELDMLKKQLAEATAAKAEQGRNACELFDALKAEQLAHHEDCARLKSELAAMAKVAEERKADVGQAHIENKRLRAVVAESLALQIQYGRVKAELESERAKRPDVERALDLVRGLEGHALRSLGAGSFVGNFTFGIRAALTTAPAPPAAVPDGGSGEDTPQWWGVWCMRLGTQAFWRQLRDGSSEILQTTRTEAERSADVLNEKQRTRIDSLGWIYEARPFPCAEQPTPDKTMTGPADKDSSSARVEGADPQTSTQSAAGSMLPTGRVQGAADPATDEGAKAAQRSESAEAGHPTQSEIARHARDDAQAAAEEARQIASAIEREPERCGGRAVIAGTRYTVAQVLTELADGETVAEIAADTSMPFTAVRLAVLAAAAEMNLVREVASEIKPSLADALEKAREVQEYLVEAAQNDWIRRTRVINDDLVRMLESLSEQAAGREST